MQSVTKVPLGFDQLKEACYGLLGSHLIAIEAFDDGWFNAAYGLVFDSGEEAVIKIAPPGDIEVMTYERDLIRGEYEVMTLLQGLVSLPKLIGADLEGSHIGRPFIIMEKLPGLALNKVIDRQPVAAVAEVRRLLGQTARAIHTQKSQTFGMIQGPRFETWPAAFTHLLLNVVEDGRRKAVDLPYDDCLDLLAETQDFLSEVTEPCLVHWDLWDGNVFVNPDSGQFVGVIDFERALYGDPLIEFCAMTLNDDVRAGYGDFDFDSKSAVARRRIYHLYLFLIMSIEGQYRQFQDQSSTKWANEKLAEVLG